jgi:hypothetical protein
MMKTSRRGGGSAFDDAISRPLLNTSDGGNQRHVSQRQHPKPSSQHFHQPPPVTPPASMFQQPHQNFDRAAATSQYKPPNQSIDRAHQHHQQQQVLLLEEQELQGGDLEEALLRERHGEFVNIHGNMQQINDIYKDLAHVVDSQQEHIDEMEMNVMNTQQSAEEGMQQLNMVAGMTLSQHVGERSLRLGSGIFVTVAFLMLVYMLCR